MPTIFLLRRRRIRSLLGNIDILSLCYVLVISASICLFPCQYLVNKDMNKLSNKVNFCNFHLRITCDYETISFWILLLNSTHCCTGLGRLLLTAAKAVSTLYSVVVLALLLTREVAWFCKILLTQLLFRDVMNITRESTWKKISEYMYLLISIYWGLWLTICFLLHLH